VSILALGCAGISSLTGRRPAIPSQFIPGLLLGIIGRAITVIIVAFSRQSREDVNIKAGGGQDPGAARSEGDR
jgi:hypothetical protein